MLAAFLQACGNGTRPQQSGHFTGSVGFDMSSMASAKTETAHSMPHVDSQGRMLSPDALKKRGRLESVRRLIGPYMHFGWFGLDVLGLLHVPSS